MAIASASTTKIGIIKETTFGTTPATPQLLAQKHSDTTFTLAIETILDESKTGSRDYYGSSQGNRTITGTINGPFAHQNYDTLLELAMFNSWETNSLSAGSTRQSITLEESQPDINWYATYKGMVANSLTIDAPNNGNVTFSMEVMALSEVVAATSISTGAYTPIPARTPFTHCKGTVIEGGSPIAYVSGINLVVNNNITAQQYWGNCDTGDLTEGRRAISGTLTVYFVSDALYNKFVSGADTSLQFTLTSGTQTMTFNLPKIRYNAADKPSPNGSDPRTVTLSFDAFKLNDATPVMTITRSAVT